MKKYNKTIFIFRRDLRTEDNKGLRAALEQSKKVIACFIFDPRQISNKNSYKSNNAIQFMLSSLKELTLAIGKKDGQLYFFEGLPDKVLKKIIHEHKIDAVMVNKDYTPFARSRDESIKKICTELGISFTQYADALLNEPETVTTAHGYPYAIFTPFYKKSVTIPVQNPTMKISNNFYRGPLKNSYSFERIHKKISTYHNKNIRVHGGSSEAKNLLKDIKHLSNYAKTRDFPAYATSFLSAHLKFGTISIRQAYWAIKDQFGPHHPLLRQLYWRDFFTHVGYNFPFVFGHAYHKKYDVLPWKNNVAEFKKWCTGTTGFPIVDAGMRELNTTGFMHNRVRMIVGSFLTKDLHIDWRWGEKYFAQQLVDYDSCVNNGNWQWVASTGCDAQPYFRIFNPWLQQKKFDPECNYIKKWIHELRSVDNKIIHTWYKQEEKLNHYHPAMLDHNTQAAFAKKIYKKISS